MSLQTSINDFDPVHDDIVNTLFNEAWAQSISVFKIVNKRIDSEVKKAAIGGRNGKCGSTIEVLSPKLAAPSPNSGRMMELSLSFIIKDWDTYAQGGNGTKLTGQQIAQRLIMTMWLYSLIGVTGAWYPEDNAFTAVADDGPDAASYKMFSVNFRAAYDLGTFARVTTPSWTDGALVDGVRTITLADTWPGGGSTIYYTLDGSLPCPTAAKATAAGMAQVTSPVYNAPLNLPVGSFLRFKAYNPTPVNGLAPLASNVGGVNVT